MSIGKVSAVTQQEVAMRIILVLLSVNALAAVWQSPNAQLDETFEVASVKPNASGDTTSEYRVFPDGAVVKTNMPVRTIIAQAYGIDAVSEQFIIIGGSKDVMSARFDIRAKPSAAAATERGDIAARSAMMMKNLLRDRFRLRLHRDTRVVPVYALTVAKEGRIGPQLRPSSHDCDAFIAAGGKLTDSYQPRDKENRSLCWGAYTFSRSGTITMRYAGSLDQLVRRTQGFVDRRLIEATGLRGPYEWQFSFSISRANSDDSLTIFTAFREQLGLKLEPLDEAVDVLIIDSVQFPDPD